MFSVLGLTIINVLSTSTKKYKCFKYLDQHFMTVLSTLLVSMNVLSTFSNNYE